MKIDTEINFGKFFGWFFRPKWKLLVIIGGAALVYAIPTYGLSLLENAVKEVAILSYVLFLEAFFALISIFATWITYKLFFGQYAEEVTPLASAFSKTEKIFDAEYDGQTTKQYTQGSLQFLNACGPVIMGRMLTVGIFFSIYMYMLNKAFFFFAPLVA